MRRNWRILFAAALIIAPVLLRWPGLEKKIWNVDEAVTFTMGQQILAGDIPYRDAVDQRNPLAPYLQAAVFAVTGDWNAHAQHLVLALMIGLTAVLLWQTARRLGHEAAGVAGALWITLLCLVLPSVRDTMPAHTAWYLIFFSCAGFWGLAQAWSTGQLRWAASCGAAFGLSVLAKQPGILDFGVVLVLGLMAAWAYPDRRKFLSRHAPVFLAGFAAPVLVTLGYFAAQGAWADLVYYTWTYNNTLYVPEIPLLERWRTIRVPFVIAWEYHPAVVVVGALAGLILLGRVSQRLRRQPRNFDLLGWMILGWCASGLVSTTLSGRGFTHYSIQLIPGLSLACGWLTAEFWTSGQAWSGASRIRRVLLWSGTALVIGWLLFPLPRRIRSFDLPEPSSDAIAELVRRHTSPHDRIFVWGYNPEIYVLSQRLPATPFLYTTFLTGLIPWTNLDPLKNTDYAVAPGAWDNFFRSWKLHPPALIADGRTQRGFLKYPLDQQPKIWPLIVSGYAEIDVDVTAQHGFWLFRRLEPVTPQPRPEGIPSSPDVQLRLVPTFNGQPARAKVQAPAATQWLELYLDGVLYRRLACAEGSAVDAVFFIKANDWSGPSHRVQAVAVNAHGRLSSGEQMIVARPPSTVIGGPPLEFGSQSIAALESSTITGGPILLKKEAPHWDGHAPSRLVYPWIPGMNSLAFSFGIEEQALDTVPPNTTDGIEVVIQVEDQAGHLTKIYHRYLDRELARRASGRVVDYVQLPKGGPGRIIMLMTPGPLNDPAYDWSYWLWIRADRSPVALLASGNPRYPVRVEAPGEVRQGEFNGQFITITEAPAVIEFAAMPDLSDLSGTFGLLDTSWLGEEKTGPVEFVVSLQKPDGSQTRLFERQLDPAHVPNDRGVKSFSLTLPQPVTGKLRFTTRPLSRPGNAHAFWGGLSASLLRMSLRYLETDIPALAGSEGRFGFLNTEEDGKQCLVAHAPATLIYPWREGMVHLTGEFGLISGAYTKPNQTEGVVFVVETENASGARQEIYRRHLDPVARKSDQGAQSLMVDIPALPGGRLLLSTKAPPSGSLNAAWSYWRNLRVAP